MPEHSGELGRSLVERERVVAVVEADLLDLVIEVAEHEALLGQLKKPITI